MADPIKTDAEKFKEELDALFVKYPGIKLEVNHTITITPPTVVADTK